MKAINCQLRSIEPLTEFVYKVRLQPEQAVNFLPGQYLNLVMAEDDKRPFSIASAPGEDFIELQIGAYNADSYASQAIEKLKTSDTVTVEAPFGEAFLREDSERPLLLVAGGTGFSYVKSILSHLVKQNSQRPVKLYWGVRDQSASFELEQTQALLDALPASQFHLVIEHAENNWQGKTGLVHKAVLQDIEDLKGYDIYIAGRFEMTGVARDDFVKQGAVLEQMYGDAFAYI